LPRDTESPEPAGEGSVFGARVRVFVGYRDSPLRFQRPDRLVGWRDKSVTEPQNELKHPGASTGFMEFVLRPPRERQSRASTSAAVAYNTQPGRA
jgi:hypothetical protein